MTIPLVRTLLCLVCGHLWRHDSLVCPECGSDRVREVKPEVA